VPVVIAAPPICLASHDGTHAEANRAADERSAAAAGDGSATGAAAALRFSLRERDGHGQPDQNASHIVRRIVQSSVVVRKLYAS
jgi:hypothetical protein